MSCHVVLIDEQAILRAGLRSLLEKEKEFKVVYDNGFSEDALESVIASQANIVIMDLSISCENLAELIQFFRKYNVAVKVIVLTDQYNDQTIQESLAIGANAYVHKTRSFDVLLEAIDTVLDGKTYVSSPISLKNDLVITDQSSADYKKVTKREREVLKLVAEGLKTKEIAVYLSLSPKTIENHRANLLSKLKFKNTPSLIYYAMEHGLI